MGFFRTLGKVLSDVGDLIGDIFGGKPLEPPDREQPEPPEPSGPGSRGGGIFGGLGGRDDEPPIEDTTFETMLYDRLDVAGWYDRSGDYHDVEAGEAPPPDDNWRVAESVVMHFHGGMWDDTYRTVTDIDYLDRDEFEREIGDVLENAYGTNPI